MFNLFIYLFTFESALVSVHCNCLIGCIVIAQGYRPLNTDNTTGDISLSKTEMKIMKQNINFLQTIILLTI